MALNDADNLELLERFDFLVKKYVPLAKELAEKFEKFGKYRKELQLISVELNNRGINPKDPEDLVKMLEDLLSRRGAQADEGHVETEGRPATGPNP